MSIDAVRVEQVFGECLAENLDAESEHYVQIDGIVHACAFDRRKLEEHRAEIEDFLANLPLAYRPPSVGGGGGWSFLNACQDKDDNQWTGLHWTMEMLVQLGIGLGLAAWLMDREMWSIFPGGMPYFSVTLPGDLAEST